MGFFQKKKVIILDIEKLVIRINQKRIAKQEKQIREYRTVLNQLSRQPGLEKKIAESQERLDKLLKKSSSILDYFSKIKEDIEFGTNSEDEEFRLYYNCTSIALDFFNISQSIDKEEEILRNLSKDLEKIERIDSDKLKEKLRKFQLVDWKYFFPAIYEKKEI